MSKGIVSTRDMLAGKPRIEGTRISVAQILEELAAGETPEDIVDTDPTLRLEDIQAAIAYAIAQMDAARVAAQSARRRDGAFSRGREFPFSDCTRRSARQ